MTYDYEAVLIGGTTYTKDSIGNQIPKELETTVLCGQKSVGRNEFYNSAKAGLKPELILVVHPYEYNEQNKVRFNNIVYEIIRTYQANSEEMELICRRI